MACHGLGTGGRAWFWVHGPGIIDWLKEASTTAVPRSLKLCWNAIDGIMQRAVVRGLARREALSPTQIGVAETAFEKRHDYVTIL